MIGPVKYVGVPADIETMTLSDFVICAFKEVEKQRSVLISRITGDCSDTVSIDSIIDEDDYDKICIANEAEKSILNLYKEYTQFDGLCNIEDNKEMISRFVSFVLSSLRTTYSGDAAALLSGVFSTKGFIIMP